MKRFPSGAGVELFDSLDSTSLEAKRWASKGEAGPRWFIALTQTAGYGRRGREWEQRAGDFAGTLLFTPEEPADMLGQVSFIVALALASSFDELMSEARTSLKWPNDLLIDGKKAAGILLESADRRLLVGIGVNIVNAPQGVAYPTARLLDHTTSPPSPEHLAARIDDHFWRLMWLWRERGFMAIRDLWLARAAGVGENILVRLPNEDISGFFETINDTGALILRSEAGKRTISAGEVFFGSPPKE